MNACQRCGAPASETAPTPSACEECPPVVCGDCGEPDDRSCSCWISIESLNIADKKALFAADGTFNIASDGSLTT